MTWAEYKTIFFWEHLHRLVVRGIGLDAGLGFNTFPRMAGGWLPPAPFRLEPLLSNLTDNAATVQRIHRWLAFVLIGTAVAPFLRERTPGADPASSRWSADMLGLLVAQAAVGIATLVLFVPIPLAAVHQALALLAFGAWTLWCHRALRAGPGALARQAGQARPRLGT